MTYHWYGFSIRCRAMIYFDFNATSPLHEAVLEAMVPYYRDFYGNPSSLHRIGRISRDAVEAARVQVAGLAGASASRADLC